MVVNTHLHQLKPNERVCACVFVSASACAWTNPFSLVGMGMPDVLVLGEFDTVFWVVLRDRASIRELLRV